MYSSWQATPTSFATSVRLFRVHTGVFLHLDAKVLVAFDSEHLKLNPELHEIAQPLSTLLSDLQCTRNRAISSPTPVTSACMSLFKATTEDTTSTVRANVLHSLFEVAILTTGSHR
uniref:Uncharacterized protein n=1 Tax=Peronospora matthiolae TaxID=2874970 RepID=A0AAV1U760_9STRA